MKLTLEEAAKHLGWASIPQGWTVVPIARCAHVMTGFVLIGGNEIHAFRLPEFKGRWLTQHDIKRVTQPLIDKYGCVTTKVPTSNATGRKFVTRLGFVKTHEFSGITHYKATRFNHARL